MLSFFARLFGRTRRLSDEELIRRINSSERPLAVCLDCRKLVQLPPCDYCKRSAPCLELRSRADIKNALASLGLEAPAKINAPPDIAPALIAAIRNATSRAKRAGQQLTTEHLLLELLADLACARVLEAFGANMERMKERLEAALPATAAGQGSPTPELEFTIRAATVHALWSKSDVVNTTDALAALSKQETTQAAQLLKEEGVSFSGEGIQSALMVKEVGEEQDEESGKPSGGGSAARRCRKSAGEAGPS
ncbi:MAG: Clp protease N-terminal domain-containing protein [Archangium sp.]|nr:Clp protease N-terminal domain-containing protein [Archangium sp.]